MRNGVKFRSWLVPMDLRTIAPAPSGVSCTESGIVSVLHDANLGVVPRRAAERNGRSRGEGLREGVPYDCENGLDDRTRDLSGRHVAAVLGGSGRDRLRGVEREGEQVGDGEDESSSEREGAVEVSHGGPFSELSDEQQGGESAGTDA